MSYCEPQPDLIPENIVPEVFLVAVQLGPMELGRIDIKYRRVNCKPPVNMMVDVDSSSGEGGWIRMTVKVSSLSSCTPCFLYSLLACWNAMR